MRGVLLVLVLALTSANASGQQEARIDVLDPHRLPLGDGRVSGEPKRGFVWSCQSNFRGGGAQHTGAWIHGETWDMTSKLHVHGRVMWPQAQFTILLD